MARFSPTRRVETTVPSVFELLNQVIDRGGEVVRSRRERELIDAEEGRRQEAHDVNVATGEAALDERGYQRGRAPEVELPPGRDIFRGARPGMAGEAAERQEGARGIFAGEQPGMARGTGGAVDVGGARTPPRRPLDAALERIQRGDVDLNGDEVVALPGAFVRGQGFVPTAVRRRDLVETTRERSARPRTGTAPGFRQVSEDLYRRPGARPPRETPEIEDRERFTAAELRQAGVPDDLIPAAVQDPVLGRQLITMAQRGEDESGRAPSTADQRLARERARERRDARMSELVLGDLNDREILAMMQEEFPDTPTSLADIRDVRGSQPDAEEPEDPQAQRRQERRDFLLEYAGDPLSFGSGPAMEQLFSDLVNGVPVDQLRRELAEAEQAGMPEDQLQRMREYLDLVAGSGYSP